MKEVLYKKYADTPAIGVLPLSNWGGLEILDLNCKTAVACFNWGTGRQMIKRHNITYTTSGKAFIRKQGRRYYLNEIMRTTI